MYKFETSDFGVSGLQNLGTYKIVFQFLSGVNFETYAQFFITLGLSVKTKHYIFQVVTDYALFRLEYVPIG